MLDRGAADHAARPGRPARRRPRHPPAGAGRPRAEAGASRRWRSTWPCPSRSPASAPAGCRRRSSPRRTSRSRSAWPTSASTPTPAQAWVELASPRRAAHGGRRRRRPGRRRPGVGHRDAGGGATAGGVRRHDDGVEPDRRADPGHAGGAVRARPRRGPRPPPGRPDPAPRGARLRDRRRGRARRLAGSPRWPTRTVEAARARRTPAADPHRRGAARRGRRPLAAAGLPGAGALAVRRAHLRPRAARQRRGRRSATCSRTGSATCGSSSTRCDRVAAGGTVLDPEVVVGRDGPPGSRSSGSPPASARSWR